MWGHHGCEGREQSIEWERKPGGGGFKENGVGGTGEK